MREATEKEDRVRKRLLVVGLLVVGVALLSGCALLDQIIGGIPGGGSGGGTASSAYPISGRMKFSLAATVWRDDGYTGKHTYAGNVATTFWSGAGTYHEEDQLFAADSWNGGDFSATSFMCIFSENERTLTSAVAAQEQANVWGGYTYFHRCHAMNVPFSHIDGNSRYYRIEGTGVRALVTTVTFVMWVPGAGGSFAKPLEWIEGGTAALTGDAGDYIEIRLDYQDTAELPELPPT